MRRIELEGQGGLIDSNGGSLLTHLLTLEVALERIEEESIVRHAIPVENLLLLLCSYAVVLVKEIKKRALWLFERGIGARLQVAKIGEDALFELLRVLDRSAKGLEAERQTSDDVCAGNVEKVVPGSC